MQLLEAMESATQERLEQKYGAQMEELEVRHQAKLDQMGGQFKGEMAEIQERDRKEREELAAKLEESTRERLEQNQRISTLERLDREAKHKQEIRFRRVLDRTNSTVRWIDWFITCALGAVLIYAIATYYFPVLGSFMMWRLVATGATIVGTYHLVQHFRQRPLFGVGNVLNGISRVLLRRAIRSRSLEDVLDQFDCRWEQGRVSAAKKQKLFQEIAGVATAVEAPALIEMVAVPHGRS